MKQFYPNVDFTNPQRNTLLFPELTSDNRYLCVRGTFFPAFTDSLLVAELDNNDYSLGLIGIYEGNSRMRPSNGNDYRAERRNRGSDSLKIHRLTYFSFFPVTKQSEKLMLYGIGWMNYRENKPTEELGISVYELDPAEKTLKHRNDIDVRDLDNGVFQPGKEDGWAFTEVHKRILRLRITQTKE